MDKLTANGTRSGPRLARRLLSEGQRAFGLEKAAPVRAIVKNAISPVRCAWAQNEDGVGTFSLHRLPDRAGFGAREALMNL